MPDPGEPADPFRFEQLLSALVINTHFKGVFVADTDLVRTLDTGATGSFASE